MANYKAAVDKYKTVHDEMQEQTIAQLRAELETRDQAVEFMAANVKEWLKNVSRTVPNQYHVREMVRSATGILAEFMEAYRLDRSAIEQEAQSALNVMIMRASPVIVDLHDTSLYDAVKYVEHVIAEHAPNRRTLHIVTGKGNQSGNDGPVIRPAVQRVLEEKNLKWTYGKTFNGDANDGMLIVYL
jgi:DNA-nicking Smr family endonuclease